MNAVFGIDHPLLATHDIVELRQRLIALGFSMTAIGKHPWGTSTSLAMFEGCLLEIMGIYDDSLIDEIPAGNFHFGRHIYEHLQQREGVALTALHSTDSQRDADRAAQAGFYVAGHLEFGRNVILPDGCTGRTKTTLALLPDPTFLRLSFFLCQQHRPDLIYVPEWLQHPNTVNGIAGITIVAHGGHHAVLKSRFGGLYGGGADIAGGMAFKTANGIVRILEPQTFTDTVGSLPFSITCDKLPFIAGMDFTLSDPTVFRTFALSSGLKFNERGGCLTLLDPALTANTVLRFFHPDTA
ncbi:VOC family protein [Pseudorhodobacter ferrugineus]|uniref:VOC family protein n=1 Tax=Pseudorhodobacter ferrugineus TaxID=77008 RepID=UPI0003B61067|nr:VOC family protein [Pseudorhodobacter ferrugineus]